jgi:glycosyltransferase involved in cell wall biosynthesis
MDLAKIMEYAQKESLVNVEFVAPMPLEKIAEEVAGAEVILTGEFGDFDKARRVISSKTFQCMAMGKPFIAGDNAANRELLQHRQEAMLCKMNDPVDLAKNIEELVDNPRLRKSLGRNALLRYQNTVSINILKQNFKSILDELL